MNNKIISSIVIGGVVLSIAAVRLLKGKRMSKLVSINNAILIPANLLTIKDCTTVSKNKFTEILNHSTKTRLFTDVSILTLFEKHINLSDDKIDWRTCQLVYLRLETTKGGEENPDTYQITTIKKYNGTVIDFGGL